ncbi:MAG: ACR3 family arsenite efflux transporter [Chloroflexia bacterium]
MPSTEAVRPSTRGIVGRLSVLDRFLPLWIFLAMAAGLLLGRLVPGMKAAFDAVSIGTVSLPIAVGLLWMMYPVLAKVRYEELGKVARAWKLFGVSIVLNWILGPAMMFGLAWLFLADLPHYRTGLVIVGLARCIAMVLIWNMLAGGDSEYCAVLVALNSVFQIVMYSPLAYFYLTLVPQWFGADTASVGVTMWDIAKSVLIFLGIPLAAGVITRFTLLRRKGREWYETRFMPRLGPTAIVGLLFTVVVMFSMQGDRILGQPLDVLRIALPLVAYFVLMFALSFLVSWALRFPYSQTVTQSFTAASNNFELAIAVAVGAFTIQSGEALATVVGPLIEVPVLIGLVYVALWARRFFFDAAGNARVGKARPAPVTVKGTSTAPSGQAVFPDGSGRYDADRLEDN